MPHSWGCLSTFFGPSNRVENDHSHSVLHFCMFASFGSVFETEAVYVAQASLVLTAILF